MDGDDNYDHRIVDPMPDNADLQRPDARLLLWAYRSGVFPMAIPENGRLEWFSPDPRGVIPLDAFHVPKNLARLVRQGRFEIRSDTSFDAVIRGCADPRTRDHETWIDRRIIHAYSDMFRRGHAHCVEAWLDGRLAGGLYGVHVGGAFFGESMFSRPDAGGSNASKVCLVHLVNHLNRRGFRILDTQFWNEHLEQFGCIEIPAGQYLDRLRAAVDLDIPWDWQPPPTPA